MIMRILKLVVAISVATITPHSSLHAEDRSMTTRLDFEDAMPGALPSGFHAGLTGKGGPVKWAIVEDASAPAGPKVLAETSADRTDYRFPIAVYDRVSARDVEVTVRFKPVSGRVDQAAGVVIRASDDDNYYVARANALENNVRLYRVVRGNRQQFAGVDVAIVGGRWQQLGLRAQGDRFTVSLDGKALFEATDRTFSEAGHVGLWTKADSVTYFDELTIRPIP
jgi:hypothetical protein